MTEETTNTQQTAGTPQPQAGAAPERPPIFGIISTILGGASLLPLLGILSPLGLLLGIIGINKDHKNTVAIIGTTLSVLGVITSPVIWGLLAPPGEHATPVAAGTYWGTVTFIAIVAIGFTVTCIKDRASKK